ncbi:hypothetical protein BAUCODRAFT_157927 [Baudoinia panamericana UAMH 10762]|uniref:Phytocyanin domain-containing protein n=1 Tax=Baudoinia panamericana (strain UAMH 10762) TaxID=717646 RepID=M2LMI0_BAUPA|nr:uncharacterized protein BAUCODRAFT_157927 [Baudoinia panamericana UAMH 10762]EMC95512.1 hypothetical protein BAUCODRAFT_157927 [Baudoinia panamericana UAMH 10762]
MIQRVLVAWVAALGAVYAQETGANNASTPTATQGEITVHYVTVGKLQNQFQPNSILAVPGDIVSFQFWPGNHSVIEAAYGYPCIPIADVTGQTGFYSGWQPTNDTTGTQTVYNVTVNDTSPVFYYCGAPGSCIGWGMLGVINPTAQTPLDTQLELAKQANYMLEPGENLPIQAKNSLSSLAATATPFTLTVTATNSLEPTTTSSPPTSATATSSPTASAAPSAVTLSSGAIAGIAVGAAAVLALAAALFFFLGRNKGLKDELTRLRGNAPAGPQSPYPSTGGATYPTGNDGWRRHSGGQLPPYQQSPMAYKSSTTVSALGMSEVLDHRRSGPRLHSRFSETSELRGDGPPREETAVHEMGVSQSPGSPRSQWG